MNKRGPEPKSISGPTNTEAQIIFPLPTGLCSFASMFIVSVSQAWTLSGTDFKISTTLFASYLVRIIVVPSILRFFKASLTPVSSTRSLGVMVGTFNSSIISGFSLGTLLGLGSFIAEIYSGDSSYSPFSAFSFAASLAVFLCAYFWLESEESSLILFIIFFERGFVFVFFPFSSDISFFNSELFGI